MLKIGQIGNFLEGDDVENIDLSIIINLSDFDVIFISIRHLNTEVDDILRLTQRLGEKYLNEAFDNLTQTSKEFEIFYEHGGVIFISLDRLPDLNEGDNKDFLPEHLSRFDLLHIKRSEFEFEEMKGSVFEYVEDFEDFDNSFGLKYHYIFKKYSGSPVLRSKKKKDVVGVKQRIKNGVCYILPSFEKRIPTGRFLEFNIFESMLGKIVSRNKNGAVDNIPSWIDDHTIYDEQLYLDKKISLQKDLKKLESLMEENDNELAKYRQLKTLIFAGDQDLESAVENAFREIGFNVVVPAGNNDDLHLIDPEFKAVVEIKGANKSGATLHAMQVEKWVSNYGLENNGEVIKGILVLNAYKDKKPFDRKENAFPKDMVDYSVLRKHCLMLSTDLLNLIIDFREKLISKNEILEALNGTVGVFKYLPKYKA